ncbi:ACP S-malonyltransferase [Bdellovibrionota bacterium FG-1]
MKKETALVICPGRGTYTATELGYLKRNYPARPSIVEAVDHYRAQQGRATITETDSAATYSASLHTSYENAPALIHACAMADFAAIDRDRFEIVAVTGNSMGWYIALAAAGALTHEGSTHLISTMGLLTGGTALGGQIIYPLFDEQWHEDRERVALLNRAIEEVGSEPGYELYRSIHLGGFEVIAGTDLGLKRLSQKLPNLENRYPMRLINHGAFHTPMMTPASQQGFAQLGPELFRAPRAALVDGRGQIWQPYSTDPARLREYTLGHQVTQPYDFTASLRVAIREFAPSKLILLGPGSNLGGAIGQTLVQMRWNGISSKQDFTVLQEKDPILLAVGRDR